MSRRTSHMQHYRQIKLAIYLDNRYLSSSDLNFVNIITSDLQVFLENASLQKVFVFPAVDSYHRLLIHKTVEDIEELRSFSLGEGTARRTVVCLQQMSFDRDIENTECMSSSPSGRGRGRGHTFRNGARGYTESSRSESPPVGDLGKLRNENGRSCVSRDSGQGQKEILETSSGADAQTVRSRVRKPEVQRYVPRGRRQQDVTATPSMEAEAPACPKSPSSRGRGRRIRSEKEIYVPRARRGQSDMALETGSTGPSLNSDPVMPECGKSCELMGNFKERQEYLFKAENSNIDELHDNELSHRLENTRKMLHDEIVPESYDLEPCLNTESSESVIHNVSDSSITVVHNVKSESDMEHSRIKKHKKDHKKEKPKGKVKKKNTSKDRVDEIPVDKTSIVSSASVFSDITLDVQSADDRTSCLLEKLSDSANGTQKVKVINGEHSHHEPYVASLESKSSKNLVSDFELIWNKSDTERSDIVNDVKAVLICDTPDNDAIENTEAVDIDIKTTFIVDNQANERTHIMLDNSQMEFQTISAMNPSTMTEHESEPRCQEAYVEKTNLILTTVVSKNSIAISDDIESRLMSSEPVNESVENINSDKCSNKEFVAHSIISLQAFIQQRDVNTDDCKDIVDDAQTVLISNSHEAMEQSGGSLISKTVSEAVCVDPCSEVIPDSISDDQKVMTNAADVMERTVQPDDEESELRADEDENELRADEDENELRRDEDENELRPDEDELRPDEDENELRPDEDENELRPDEDENELRPDEDENELRPDEDENELRPDEKSELRHDGDDESEQQPGEESEHQNDDDDEDCWDKLFDDNGDCIDPKFMEELTSMVGNVQIEEPSVINYLAFQPKERDMDYEAYGHVVEIYDFAKEFITRDLIMTFQEFMSRGFDVKWVDDTHALGIFSSAIAAQDALRMMHPLLKIRCLSEATRQSKVKARKTAEFIQPFKARPKTSAVAARRLVAGVLGLAPRISREKREEERNQLKEAKAKRRLDKKQKVDIWEGSFGKCAMDEES